MTVHNTERMGTRIVPELVARVIVLCVCGPLCFLCAAETLRALENDNFTLHDAPLPLGAVVLSVVLVRNTIRLRTLVWTAFADYFSDYVALHHDRPSILNPLLYRPVSERNWPPMIAAVGLIAVMMVMTWQVASMRGQSESHSVPGLHGNGHDAAHFARITDALEQRTTHVGDDRGDWRERRPALLGCRRCPCCM